MFGERDFGLVYLSVAPRADGRGVADHLPPQIARKLPFDEIARCAREANVPVDEALRSIVGHGPRPNDVAPVDFRRQAVQCQPPWSEAVSSRIMPMRGLGPL